MNLAALIRILGAKGLSADAIADVIEAASPKSTGAERTRRWREKKEADALAAVTVTPVTVTPVTSVTKAAPAPVHTRGEETLSRLDTTGLVVVGGVGAREPDQPTDDWPTGDAATHAKLLIQHVASPWLDPQKSPDLTTTRGRVAAWKRDGASWVHDVLPTIEGLCANRRSAVSSWKFFDAAIGRAIAENRAALLIPEAQARAPPRKSLADQIGDERRRATELTLASLKASNG